MVYREIAQISTPRLWLRKLCREDVQAYYDRIGSRPEVTAGMLWEPHRDISDSVASIEKALHRYAAGKCYRWGIELPGEGLIGVIELLGFDENAERCSFAYMLCPEYWGQGYGTEALRAALDFAFTRLEIKQVVVDHFTTNPASGAVMRKAGMQFQGILPEKYEKQGKKLDAAPYSITKEAFYDKETALG